jgi:hypothetical protein
MARRCFFSAAGLNCLIAIITVAEGAPLTVTVGNAPPAREEVFHMGAAAQPGGATITIGEASLRLDGRPWIPVMGEFHYTRYPASEWREELLKMKAGGVSIVSTYVFWIHHEEIEGVWNWSGDRDLHEFVRLAGSVGLKVVVRCGPWCHGEVRNGGFPDWLVEKGWPLRSLDARYLGKVRVLYGEIAKHLDGLLWKDGGPVIGIQLDNEYGGPAEYLLALKRIARDEGLDVPLYTRTGWPQLTTPMPFGEIVPLYGAYADGFWARELTSMPLKFWTAFRFSPAARRRRHHSRSRRAATTPYRRCTRYPYLTCEIGGGMMSSYHRRILINPEDVESTVLVKLGSGSTMPGYYMYHGGTNPDGKLTTLMEAQDTDDQLQRHACEELRLPGSNRRIRAASPAVPPAAPPPPVSSRTSARLLARMPAADAGRAARGQRDDTATLLLVRAFRRHERLRLREQLRALARRCRRSGASSSPSTCPSGPVTFPAGARHGAGRQHVRLAVQLLSRRRHLARLRHGAAHLRDRATLDGRTTFFAETAWGSRRNSRLPANPPSGPCRPGAAPRSRSRADAGVRPGGRGPERRRLAGALEGQRGGAATAFS